MRKPLRTITLTVLAITAASAVSDAEAWSFGTQRPAIQRPSPSGNVRGHGLHPQQRGSGYGFTFGYSSGGLNSCSQPYGGFYSDCQYGGSSFGPSTVLPPAYPYSPYGPGFEHGYEDGYYHGYYDGQTRRRHTQKFRPR